MPRERSDTPGTRHRRVYPMQTKDTTLEQQRNTLGELIIRMTKRGDISTARWLERDLMRLDARMQGN